MISGKRKTIGVFLCKAYSLFDNAVYHTLEKEAFKAGINRIIIKNDIKNMRSAHVAERCGYTFEGIMRQDAWDEVHKCFRDTNIFSKLKSDKR